MAIATLSPFVVPLLATFQTAAELLLVMEVVPGGGAGPREDRRGCVRARARRAGLTAVPPRPALLCRLEGHARRAPHAALAPCRLSRRRNSVRGVARAWEEGPAAYRVWRGRCGLWYLHDLDCVYRDLKVWQSSLCAFFCDWALILGGCSWKTSCWTSGDT